MTEQRVISLEAVHNFRDYGAYPVAGGGRLRSGVLYRSAQHAGATVQDLETIAALGLATVIDFRGTKERAAHPCPRPPGFAAEVVAYEGETTGLPPHLQAELAGLDAAGIRAMMAGIYRNLPMREGLLEMLRRYFRALARHDGASLTHCVAGKDRTGMAVALFHTALGVHPDDAMADYLLTNTAGNPEARLAAAAASVRRRYGRISDEALRTILSVAPDYLDAAFAAISQRHGSVDSFLETALGVGPEIRESLKARYLEA